MHESKTPRVASLGCGDTTAKRLVSMRSTTYHYHNTTHATPHCGKKRVERKEHTHTHTRFTNLQHILLSPSLLVYCFSVYKILQTLTRTLMIDQLGVPICASRILCLCHAGGVAPLQPSVCLSSFATNSLLAFTGEHSWSLHLHV